MTSTPRPSAVVADGSRIKNWLDTWIMASDSTYLILLDLPTERTWRRRQRLNAEPVWPSLITHDPQL